MSAINLIPMLDYIDPRGCSYEEWTQIGQALKTEGYSADDWDSWSANDSLRYHQGECARKWATFKGTGITGATITELAKRGGWVSQSAGADKSYSWDDIVGADSDYVIVDSEWIEGAEIAEPKKWDPVKDVTTYLSALFDSTDIVGYVTDATKNDAGKWRPDGRGISKKTAGQIIEKLEKCKGNLSVVFGDLNPEAGAWIRFNPLDGEGVADANVKEFRYALVESDNVPIEKQYAIMQKLELPIATLVHSGNKSLHAIVHIDAGGYDEYRKRVDYLYDICGKNGLEVDRGNKNPSRLSRMPGVMRHNKKQFLVATNIGKADFASWRDWVEEVNDNLPDIEHLADEWDHLPQLAPELIHGVLRCGHKMLLAGPSKAGKSFALIELVIAIAEGKMWMGFPCKIGRILYVNLELDRASCLHRFKDVYEKLGIRDYHISNVDIWNLRGKSVPMDKLAPKLIRRAQKGNYTAVVIDPIYKIITGDENSADQMAHFCNQFDKVCTELGCAVIYCHHHSKGAQGGKRSMDRASGSGVFARDPDALIDMIQLAVDDEDERTAWRLEGTLREFKAFDPINVYFDYPVHVIDTSGLLDEAKAIGDIGAMSRKGVEARQSKAEERRGQYPDAYEACRFASTDGRVTKKAMADYFGIDEKTIARDLKNKDSIFKLEKGIIIKVLDTGQNP